MNIVVVNRMGNPNSIVREVCLRSVWANAFGKHINLCSLLLCNAGWVLLLW